MRFGELRPSFFGGSTSVLIRLNRYYYHVYGRPQNGRAVPVDASIGGLSTSSCATSEGALRYLERTPSSVRKL